jgi:hypothetical protein
MGSPRLRRLQLSSSRFQTDIFGLCPIFFKHEMTCQAVLHLCSIHNVAFALEVDVRMPSIPAVPDIGEIYLCTSVPLPEPDQTLYATSFHPKAKKKFVHHFVVFGCMEPPVPNNGFIPNSNYSSLVTLVLIKTLLQSNFSK